MMCGCGHEIYWHKFEGWEGSLYGDKPIRTHCFCKCKKYEPDEFIYLVREVLEIEDKNEQRTMVG